MDQERIFELANEGHDFNYELLDLPDLSAEEIQVIRKYPVKVNYQEYMRIRDLDEEQLRGESPEYLKTEDFDIADLHIYATRGYILGDYEINTKIERWVEYGKLDRDVQGLMDILYGDRRGYAEAEVISSMETPLKEYSIDRNAEKLANRLGIKIPPNVDKDHYVLNIIEFYIFKCRNNNFNIDLIINAHNNYPGRLDKEVSVCV